MAPLTFNSTFADNQIVELPTLLILELWKKSNTGEQKPHNQPWGKGQITTVVVLCIVGVCVLAWVGITIYLDSTLHRASWFGTTSSEEMTSDLYGLQSQVTLVTKHEENEIPMYQITEDESSESNISGFYDERGQFYTTDETTRIITTENEFLPEESMESFVTCSSSVSSEVLQVPDRAFLVNNVRRLTLDQLHTPVSSCQTLHDPSFF
ncbi:hypothetical protein NCAS_0B03280 [Naumovozyma castellii]|uniref:Uncharacterized protein n=1 Tax=Naumovozyma castellii TaxID=27288 RepID=G0VBT6_NAUCA|nr:hypothetical protein NCAS_0B03280 [Naumovozyma castellii CBS 4309]CCC68412.1 hypothetical protein NCAS_0B03280 [Naumovozyma castellii CBS 4309]